MILQRAHSSSGWQLARAYPVSSEYKWRPHPGPSPLPLEGHCLLTPNSHSYWNHVSTSVHLFVMWEEAKEPGGNPWRHVEHVPPPHRKVARLGISCFFLLTLITKWHYKKTCYSSKFSQSLLINTISDIGSLKMG